MRSAADAVPLLFACLAIAVFFTIRWVRERRKEADRRYWRRRFNDGE